MLDRVTGEPIWPIVETPVLQSEVPGEQTSPTQPIPVAGPRRTRSRDCTAADLIDYTPAIKDSALKLAKKCRMGPYFIPAVARRRQGEERPERSTAARGTLPARAAA